MSKLPRISVIMGVCNGGETLELAIESIQAQTYSAWEFIICDDCSSDESWYILSKFKKDSRFVIIRNEENLGLGATLNKCSRLAKGEYLARMDADDISCPTRFAEQIFFLDNNPFVKVLGTWAFLYDENDEIWGSISPPAQPTIQDWLYGPSVIHASVMMRREALISIGGYNPQALRIEDYDLWLRMLAANYEIESIPQQLYGIRWMRGDYSRKKIKYRILDFKCRLKHFHKLHVSFIKYWFVLKPLLPILVPKFIYSIWHMKILKGKNRVYSQKTISDYCPSYYSDNRRMTNPKILLFARYGVSGASTRVRSLQYFSYLRRHGYKVKYSILLGESYIKSLYEGQSANYANVIKSYLKRCWLLVKVLLRVERFDVVWIEYEIFPWMPAVGEKLLQLFNIPFFVDYDDAVFHKYDKHENVVVRYLLKNKIDKVMKYSSLTIAGNDYIRQRAQKAKARNVELLPTVVDVKNYKKSCLENSCSEVFTIGWIGSPSTSKYLLILMNALLCLRNKIEYRLVFVGDEAINLERIPVELHKWSMATEVEEIQSFDVGVMPLPNGFFEKGKCGYKLIQYMACEVPVIASPVGVNKNIVDHGVNGFLAETAAEWLTHLEYLALNPADREKMGKKGRDKVIKQYSYQVMSPKLLYCINKIM